MVKDIQNKMVKKSEIGAEAAWRGFSTQTLYIAKVLLTLKGDRELYPERVEDLMIKERDKVVELIQIKNLSAPLSLSKLEPQKQDSFFRRCLEYREQQDIILRVISFGEIGEEIKNMFESSNKMETSVANKMKRYGYEDEEVKWLLEHISIEKVDEIKLIENIRKEIEKYIEISASFELAYESLIYYVFELSRYSKSTSKEKWEEKMDKIAKNIMAIESMSKQYQKTIIPLHEYKSNKSLDELTCDYRMGVNAIPDHIRCGCDIVRKKWLKKLEDNFMRSNIVVVKGASGQGKSTLSYRYLINNYPEINILCISKIVTEEQANDILTVIRGLEERKQIIVYIDVEPYDTNWLWICEQAELLGLETKILISIREEDFQRSSIDYSKHRFEELNLYLSREEAEEIYLNYNRDTFLSFDEAWKSFGEKGPLMEYIYMLNESQTMIERIRAQIRNIILQEEEADSWLQILSIISLAGKYNNKVNIARLFEKKTCNQKQKMMQQFVKEYFIRLSSEKTYIECLHVLRAQLIFDVLKEECSYTYKEILLDTLAVVENNATMMLIEFSSQEEIDDEIVSEIASVDLSNIEIYADVVRALLWCEIQEFIYVNNDVIEAGNEMFNGQFISLGKADITGLLDSSSIKGIYKLFNTVKPDFETQMKSMLEKLPMQSIDYQLLDLFFNKTYEKVVDIIQWGSNDLSALGYVLFWFTYRNIFLKEEFVDVKGIDNININNLEGCLNLLLGVRKQGWNSTAETIWEKIRNKFFTDNNIIFFKLVENEMYAYAYISLVDNNEHRSFNRIAMNIVDCCRRIEPNVDKYNVKLLGTEIMGDMKIPDIEKNIPKENLHFSWITQLNASFNRISEYSRAPETWKDVYESIMEARRVIVDFAKLHMQALEKYYRNGNTTFLTNSQHKIMEEKAFNESKINPFCFPKCALDKYGMRENNYVVENDTEKYKFDKNREDKKNHISKVCGDYFSAINLFMQNKNKIIIEASKGSERTQKARIAYFNLLQALQKLYIFQSKMRTYFKDFISDYDENEEMIVIEGLSAVYTYIFFNKYIQEKSLGYHCKESMKKTKKKIEDFLDNGIKSIEGVKEVNRVQNVVNVEIDALCMTNFLHEIFVKVKSLSQEMSNISFSGILFSKYFDYIRVNVLCDEEASMAPLKIENRSFLIYDAEEKFCSTILPEESYENIEIKNVKHAAMQFNNCIESLKMLFKYEKEIEKTLQNVDANGIVEISYDKYQDETGKIVDEVVDKMKESYTYISTNLESHVENIDDIKKEVDELMETIKECKFELAKQCSSEKIDNYMEAISDKIWSFMDLYNYEL